MAKKSNKYAGFQAVEDVMGVGAYVGLGRPVDLDDNTTRLAIVGALISMGAVTAWQMMGNVDIWDAAFTGMGAALGFLFSYMLAQELDPDRKFGGIIGGILTMVAVAFLDEKTKPLSYDVAWWKKLIRIVVGVVLAVALKEVIKMANVFDVMQISLLIDALRYFIVVMAVGYLCPLIFKKIKL